MMHRLTKQFLSPLLRHSLKNTRTMSQTNSSSAVSPVFTLPAVRLIDKTTIDKESFKKPVTFPALHVHHKLLNGCRKVFKRSVVGRKKFHYVRQDPADKESKYVLLNPDVVKDVDSLTEEQGHFLEENKIEKKLQIFEVELTYDDWFSDEVLRAVLPQGMEVPTSFSVIGHIAHLNLREEQLDYKHLIGQVLLDKQPRLKTVVNKVGEISNEFRVFEMELLAGEDNMVALVREHGHAFQFDFSKVYWNPRLSTEHDRIANQLGKDDVLYDMFAGVGPFAIPAAKRKCLVIANDLNPESYKWLTHNAKLNKVQDRVRTYNLDARKFVQEVVKDDLIAAGKKAKEGDSIANTHVVMNLPSIAIDFLDVFGGLFTDVPDDLQPHIPIPTVHCHCFSTAEDTTKDVCQRINDVLRENVDNISVHDVRNVAPNKEMLCASFRLPKDVVFGRKEPDMNACTEPGAKKQRCE